MFRTAWTFGHLRGVPLRMHFSVLVVVPLIAWSVAARDVPVLLNALGLPPGELRLPALALGLAVAVVVLAGVLLHELGHALTALAVGARVRSITLMILGGITEIDQTDVSPRQRFWVALNGPLVSFGLGAAALLLARGLTMPVDLLVVLLVFGWLNVLIAGFNMLPASPLDGGRVLRAALESRLGPARAARATALVGRTLGIALVAFGVVQQSLLLLILGALAWLGARVEREQTADAVALDGLLARHAMLTEVATLPPQLRPAEAARALLERGAEAAIVRDLSGTRGVVLAAQLNAEVDTIGELLDGEPLYAAPETPLGEVVRAIRWGEQPAIVVDEFNAPVGVVTLERVHQAARLRRVVESV